MTFAGASAGAFAAIAAGAVAAITALYLLKLRRRVVEVAFTKLWARVLAERESTRLLRRWRRWLSWALQVAAALALALALRDPRLGDGGRAGRAVVLLVDVSASMRARDEAGGRSRLEAALDEARRVVRGLSAADQALVATFDARTTPRSPFDPDPKVHLAALDGIAATDGPADLARALAYAADALRGRPRPTVVVVGDGRYGEAPAPPGVDLRFAPVGRSGDDLGLTAFSVRRYPTNKRAYEVLVEVASARAARAVAQLELRADGELVDVRRLELAPGERQRRIFSDLGGPGQRLEARLLSPGGGPLDRYDVDDRAYALLPPHARQRVLLVTDGNLYLEGALLLDEEAAVERIAPAAFAAARLDRFDVVVLDRYLPEALPARGSFLLVDPPAGRSPIAIRGALAAPVIDEVATAHPLLRWVSLADVNVTRASVFAPRPGDVALASSARAPLAVARAEPGRRLVALGFDVRRSDLPLRVAFPVLLLNALDWFAGEEGEPLSSHAVGRTWRLPLDGADADAQEATLTAPGGEARRAPVVDGRVVARGDRVGFWSYAAAGGAARSFAAALDPTELDVRPQRTLTAGGRRAAAPEPGPLAARRTLWPYLLGAVLALALGEWVTYHRRWTV